MGKSVLYYCIRHPPPVQHLKKIKPSSYLSDVVMKRVKISIF